MSLFHCKIWLQGQAWKIMFSGYYPLWVRFLSCENPNSYGPSGQQTPAFTQVFEVRPKRCYRKIRPPAPGAGVNGVLYGQT